MDETENDGVPGANGDSVNEKYSKFFYNPG